MMETEKPKTILDRALDGALLFAMLISLSMVFVWVPTEKAQGIVQRIFYFHVPSAWVAFLAFFVVFAASLKVLFSRSESMDRLAVCSAEVGVLFCTLVLVTGPIWGKAAWGIWWTWDARLTSTLVLWLLYVGYLMVRAFAADEEKKVRISAVVGIVGFLNVPFVVLSIRWLRTQHPSPVIGGGEGSGLAPQMLATLLVCLATFTLLYVSLLRRRLRLERLIRTVDGIRHQLEERSR